jgi:hypothetical protein
VKFVLAVRHFPDLIGTILKIVSQNRHLPLSNPFEHQPLPSENLKKGVLWGFLGMCGPVGNGFGELAHVPLSRG